MKKVFAILMVMVMIMLVPGCGRGDSKPETNTVNLTLDNYSDYLDIDIAYQPGNEQISSDGTLASYYSIDADYKVIPASSVFLYNDVTVTVKLSGIIDRGNKTDKVSFDETTINCNIGGNGSKSESHMLLTEPILKGLRYTNETVTLSYTVVNVTGTVSRA